CNNGCLNVLRLQSRDSSGLSSDLQQNNILFRQTHLRQCHSYAEIGCAAKAADSDLAADELIDLFNFRQRNQTVGKGVEETRDDNDIRAGEVAGYGSRSIG